MIRQTGGRASAFISTRSRPRSRARRSASWVSTTPAFSLFSSISWTGEMRIRSFMRGPVGRMSSRRNPLRRMAMVEIPSSELKRETPIERFARSGAQVNQEDVTRDESRGHGHAGRGHEIGRTDSCMEQRFRGGPRAARHRETEFERSNSRTWTLHRPNPGIKTKPVPTTSWRRFRPSYEAGSTI